MRKAGNRVRITAQLVNAADGFHLWSETYDREMNDIFAVQDDISGSVTNALKVTLLDRDKPGSRATNAAAFNLYLQGRRLTDLSNRTSLESAVSYHQQALEHDPNYAPAWAGLAMAHCAMADFALIPFDEGFSKARREAERALELEPNLAGSARHAGPYQDPIRLGLDGR